MNWNREPRVSACISRARAIAAITLLAGASPAALDAHEPRGVDDSLEFWNRKVPDCRSVTFHAMELVPDRFERGELDSLQAVLDSWELMCGSDEAITRARVLVAIYTGDFGEFLYDDSIVPRLIEYKRGVRAWQVEDMFRPYYRPRTDPGLQSIMERFDRFTASLATGLLENGRLSGLEYALCSFYAGDHETLFHNLRAGEFGGTVLQDSYDELLEETRSKGESGMVFYTGAWIPRGANVVLGPHPLAGIALCGRVGRVRIGAAGEGRWARASESFYVGQGGRVKPVRSFGAAYVGLEGGYELFRGGPFVFTALGGVGYEAIEALAGNWLKSFNFNWGPGLELHFGPQGVGVVGIEARYNHLNFATHGGSDLTGDSVTLRFTIGGSGNAMRNNRLDALEFHGRP